MLAVVRRGEQAIHESLVGVVGLVPKEGVGFRRRGRQAGKIEREPADQSLPRCLGRRGKLFCLQRGEDEPVHFVVRPVGLLNGRRLLADGRFKGPMSLILRALLDPLAERSDLFRLELLARIRRRHVLFRVGGVDAPPEVAGLEVAGLDGHRSVFVRRGHTLWEVEPQVGLALRGVKPMAIQAVVSEDRPDVAVESNRCCGSRIGLLCGGWPAAGQRRCDA